MNKIAEKLASMLADREVSRFRVVLASVLIVALLLAGAAMAQPGGDYDLSWWTVNNGGSSSAGGAYTLAGAVGQPDAGVMAGGDYLLAGGFLPGGELPEWFRVYLPVVVRNH